MKARTKSGAFTSFWQALSPLSKAATVLLPILAVMGILAPYATSMIGRAPFAHISVEARVQVVEARLDLQERIALQKEILKVEEEARRRRLTEPERNYLEDLKQRLKELERRK